MAKTKEQPPVKEAKKCAVSRADFLRHAKPISVNVNGVPMAAVVKEFSTGSFGWYLTGKTTIDIGGTPMDVQIGCNLTAVGSKNGNK